MFERFNYSAIQSIMLAQEETRRVGHSEVDTDHILLGLFSAEGIAKESLKFFGATLKAARVEAEKQKQRGPGFSIVEIPFTAHAKRALEYGWDTARVWGHRYIGTEHLIMGLLKVEDSAAVKVLQALGISTTELETQVKKRLQPVEISPDWDYELEQARREDAFAIRAHIKRWQELAERSKAGERIDIEEKAEAQKQKWQQMLEG